MIVLTDDFATIRRLVEHLSAQTIARDVELVVVCPSAKDLEFPAGAVSRARARDRRRVFPSAVGTGACGRGSRGHSSNRRSRRDARVPRPRLGRATHSRARRALAGRGTRYGEREPTERAKLERVSHGLRPVAGQVARR